MSEGHRAGWCIHYKSDPRVQPKNQTCNAGVRYVDFNGGKATCADGDIHKIAKAKRIAKAREAHAAVVAKVMERPAGAIRSRGFDKGLRRRFDGRVERRG